jgi:hypothetical protein
MSTLEGDTIHDILADCWDDLPLFHEAVLGRPPFHPKQEQIAKAVTRSKVVVVPAAHAVGKSWSAASIILGWLNTRPGAKVVTTSVSNTQLVTVLWSEVKAAHSRALIPLSGQPSEGHAIPQRLELEPDWYAIGWSAKKAESFSGIHGGNLLVVVDEASGVEDPIWDAIESLGYDCLLALGNPIHSEGRFKQLADLAKAGEPGCELIHLEAFDSPHAHLTKSEVKAQGLPVGLCTKDWIDQVKRLYGEGSLYWLTRVLARFPTEDHTALLPPPWVDGCRNVGRPVGNPPPPWIIVDISKGTGKDRTVLLVADYHGVRDLKESNKVGVEEAAREVAQLAPAHGVPANRIVFDAGGWAGSDMRRYLDAHGLHGAIGYFGSGKGGERYANKRARSAWRLRQRLDPDRAERVPKRPVDPAPIPTLRNQRTLSDDVKKQPRFHIPSGPWWPELREELLGLRYGHEDKIALEKKEDFALRLGRSPDLADVFIMLASVWPGDD